METVQRKAYVPAAGRHWLLPLYDPLLKLLGADQTRHVLLEQAALQPGQRVLDIGCGTGTLVTLIKRLHPQAEVTGLDPDCGALARAERKARRAQVTVQLDQGYSDDLPYADSSFDRVFSTFMYHHLPREAKAHTLREVHRVLKPGGTFHFMDFAGPEKNHGFLAHLVHASDRLRDNSEALVLAGMLQAGLSARKTAERRLVLGRVAYYAGEKAVG